MLHSEHGLDSNTPEFMLAHIRLACLSASVCVCVLQMNCGSIPFNASIKFTYLGIMARVLTLDDPPSAGCLMNVSTGIPSRTYAHTESAKMIMIASHSMQMQVCTVRRKWTTKNEWVLIAKWNIYLHFIIALSLYSFLSLSPSLFLARLVRFVPCQWFCLGLYALQVLTKLFRRTLCNRFGVNPCRMALPSRIMRKHGAPSW